MEWFIGFACLMFLVGVGIIYLGGDELEYKIREHYTILGSFVIIASLFMLLAGSIMITEDKDREENTQATPTIEITN